MKQFKDYAETTTFGTSERLPAGGYVLKILNVRYEEGQNGMSDRIQLMFDIAEGDYAGFFQKQYEAQTGEDKKWKGTMPIYVPTDDGSEKDGWTKKSFKTIIENFEASNPTFKWAWDENALKGLVIGGLFADTYTVIDGREVVYTSLVPKNVRAVDVIRNKKFSIPDPIKKGNATGTVTQTASPSAAPGFMSIPNGVAEEIPF